MDSGTSSNLIISNVRPSAYFFCKLCETLKGEKSLVLRENLDEHAKIHFNQMYFISSDSTFPEIFRQCFPTYTSVQMGNTSFRLVTFDLQIVLRLLGIYSTIHAGHAA